MAKSKRKNKKDISSSGTIPVCFRKSQVELFIVSSSTRQRWVLPKGNIETGETAIETCSRETMEEAGLQGEVMDAPIRAEVSSLSTGDLCFSSVSFYPFFVENELADWPEKKTRKRKSVPLSKAHEFLDTDEYGPVLEHINKIAEKHYSKQ